MRTTYCLEINGKNGLCIFHKTYGCHTILQHIRGHMPKRQCHDAGNGLNWRTRPLQLVLSGGPVTPIPIKEYNGLRGENGGPFKSQQASASNPVMSYVDEIFVTDWDRSCHSDAIFVAGRTRNGHDGEISRLAATEIVIATNSGAASE